LGTEGALTFIGKSMVVDPKGEIIAEASENKEEFVVADIDVSLIEKMRKEWPFLRDRRPNMYGDLL
jgi:predicted amidohydrolase